MENNKEPLVYLKPNVAAEPLFDRWYAWTHLISPTTSALNIKERHLKIMDSFIKNPLVHEAAVKTPAMRGGPFIDYPKEKVGEIEQLMNSTISKHEKRLALADALVELNNMLLHEAKGYSIEPLYDKVPEILKGYVELVYDLNNRPSFRVYEELLYSSDFYDESAQSMALQLVDADDSRSFVLSTPRLNDEDTLHLDIPMKDPVWDEFFKMEREASSFEAIKNRMKINPEQEELFKSFFTSEEPKKYNRYEGEGILTRYFGHACVLIETKGVAILVDPVISYGYESDLSRYTYEDLPDVIDFVLITHNHQDHVMYETLMRLRHKIKNIVVPRSSMGTLQDPSLKINLKKVGFQNVIEIEDIESIELSGCSITGLPFLGEHGDLDVRSKLCYQVDLDNRLKVLFVADSCNIEPKIYQHIQEMVGDIDVLFLGMECDGAPMSWLYGALLPSPLERDKDHSRRLAGSNFDRGFDLITRFSPKDVFVYAMGMEPWLEYISSIKYTDESKPIIESSKLIEECLSQGITAERLYGEKTIEY
jgi:L-ascorbate metabolism protein UlaG (beta-lactamase superfamily)